MVRGRVTNPELGTVSSFLGPRGVLVFPGRNSCSAPCSGFSRAPPPALPPRYGDITNPEYHHFVNWFLMAPKQLAETHTAINNWMVGAWRWGERGSAHLISIRSDAALGSGTCVRIVPDDC